MSNPTCVVNTFQHFNIKKRKQNKIIYKEKNKQNADIREISMEYLFSKWEQNPL